MERQAFETLAMAELDAVYRYARFLARDGVRAEDLVQDVYSRAFRRESIESFESRAGGMRCWLLAITRSRFYGDLAHTAAGARAMESVVRDARTAEEATEATVAESIDWTQARRSILQAMNGLSDELREVLWLWGVEGLKYREIAESLGVPLGTVMSRLHRARSQATEALAKATPETTDVAEPPVIRKTGRSSEERARHA